MIQKSLYWKLTLAFVLVAFVSAGLLAVFIRATSTDRLNQLIIDQQTTTMEQLLVTYYGNNGSWQDVSQNWRQLQSQSQPTQTAAGQNNLPPVGRPPGQHDRRSFFGLADASGIVLVSVDNNYPEGTKLPDAKLKEGHVLILNGAKIGTILVPSQSPGFNPAEAQFLDRTNQALTLATIGALLVALVIGILLARTLTRPLRALTSAAHRIADGQLDQQVPVKSRDEIGQLAEAFNRMSRAVAQANLLRRQMTADIAHDLRTPLTVIAGYIEAMQEGVLQPTPARLNLIYTEIERLQDMVGDLRLLSQADAGDLPLMPQWIAPTSLLKRAAALFQHRAEQQGIHLELDCPTGLPDMYMDEARMMQVLDNLISNAIRYTPDGGRILLAGQVKETNLILKVQDNGNGIASDDLPHIFERFYRADTSRRSDTGESGLGLAIVKALVQAHHGRVWAESIQGEGTTMIIEIPLGALAPTRNGEPQP